MAKKIYLNKFCSYLNQRLANLIINKNILVYKKNSFHKYKKIYPMSKTWILFKFNLCILK